MTREDYEALALKISEQAIRDAQHRSLKQYVAEHWIAVLSLIVAVIALFK